MAHTSETQYYGLPIFTGNDILNPLTDLNGAMTDIDTAMHEVAVNSGNASATADEAKETAEAMEARIVTLESQMTDVEEAQDDLTATVADTFDPLKVGGYAIGDIVIYEGKMYQFVNAHSGAWSASDVTEINVSEILKQTTGMLAGEFDPAKVGGYEAGDYVIYGGKLYKFTRVHTGAWNVSDVDEVTVGEEMKTSAGALANLSGMRVKGAPGTFTIAENAPLNNIRTQILSLWTNKPSNAVDLVIDSFLDGFNYVPCHISMVDTNALDNDVVINLTTEPITISGVGGTNYYGFNASILTISSTVTRTERGINASAPTAPPTYLSIMGQSNQTDTTAFSDMVFKYHYEYEI